MSIYQDYAAPHGPEVFDRWATRGSSSSSLPEQPCSQCGKAFRPVRKNNHMCGADACLKAYQRARRNGTLKTAEERAAEVAKYQQAQQEQSHAAYKAWVADLTLRLGRKPDFFDMIDDRKRQQREAGREVEDDDDDITEFAYR
jgi:hypothetical protein